MRHWPAARALLITFAILVGLIDGCPLPPAKKVPAAVRPVYDAVKTARFQTLRPFAPVRDAFRLQQRWKLFPTAREAQHRMWVEARTKDGPWELLYRPHEPDHAFHADEIEYRKLRGAWNPGNNGPRRGYGPFVKWLAHEVFDARPDLKEVRVRMEKIRIEPDGDGSIPLGEFEFLKTRRRPTTAEPTEARPPVVPGDSSP